MRISEYSKVTANEVNIQKSIVFLHTRTNNLKMGVKKLYHYSGLDLGRERGCEWKSW